MKNIILFSTVVLAMMLQMGCNKDTPMSINSTTDESATLMNDVDRRSEVSDLVVEYEITLENLTPNHGGGAAQPFSPPVFASHAPLFHIFQEGKYASYEIRRIAEEGDGKPMAALVSHSPQVLDVAQGSGLILPGQSATFEIEAKLGFHKLSFACMLGITNDGFTGLDAITLPKSGSVTYYIDSYDAGTEKNTESKAHLGAFGNPDVRVPTMERIHSHPGITGKGDLDPAIYGWEDPVGKVTITMKSVS